ncbi:unnamed protein product, partial [Aureobasidium pullulans]
MTSQITVKSTVSTVITHTAVVPQSSPVSPEQTTPASFAGHVAVPSTVTLYSTKENSAPVASVPVSSAPVAAVPTTAPFAVNNSTMMSVGPTGTGMVGTGSGSKATSTFSPSQYTGAANKAGVAGLAGVAAFAAFLL